MPITFNSCKPKKISSAVRPNCAYKDRTPRSTPVADRLKAKLKAKCPTVITINPDLPREE